MDPMLEAFLQESRDNLEAVGRCFLAIENNADDETMNNLFRSIHTIKGSSGLFDIAPLTRVVHAAEDVLDVAREGELTLTPEHIDLFLDAMDQVEAWLDDLQNTGELGDNAEANGQVLAEQLRALLGANAQHDDAPSETPAAATDEPNNNDLSINPLPSWFHQIPNDIRLNCVGEHNDDNDLFALVYTPDEQCFFNGHDPIHTVQNLNNLHWFYVEQREDWGDTLTLDPFHCNLRIYMLASGKEADIREYFRYVSEQISLTQLQFHQLIFPVGDFGDGTAYEAFLIDAERALANNDINALQQCTKPLLEIGSAELFQTSALSWIAQLSSQYPNNKTWLQALVDSIRSGEFKPLEFNATNEAENNTDSNSQVSDSNTISSVDAPEKHGAKKATVTSIATAKQIIPATDISSACQNIFNTQLHILDMPYTEKMFPGRIQSTTVLLHRIFKKLGWEGLLKGLNEAAQTSIDEQSGRALSDYLQSCMKEEVVQKIEVPQVPKPQLKPTVSLDDIPATIKCILDTQLHILNMACPDNLLLGRIMSTLKVLTHLFKTLGWDARLKGLEESTLKSIEEQTCNALTAYLQTCMTTEPSVQNTPTDTTQKNTSISDAEIVPISTDSASEAVTKPEATSEAASKTAQPATNPAQTTSKAPVKAATPIAKPAKAAQKPLDNSEHSTKQANTTLRVDQVRIDTLMDLVGELVVAKNSLPFLAKRAEETYNAKELSKEIKAQYSVINRLAEELQNAMMSVRMVPVSSVFQRFPRLVRDLSRRLGKKIELVMEGEETEADKNVIENLADPLIHLVRNSLDHGIEMPETRIAAGKPETGTLILRAIPMDDQVIIEIIDDGKGIDPNIIKQKAYEKGVIDEEKLDSISDQEAIELIFAAGLSSKEEASDLSGRGVGMDVVRTAVKDAGGSVSLKSEVGKGSTLRLTLPLSMAVAQVMMVEVDQQTYGISMDNIRETVRVPIESIQKIKHSETIILRDKLIPLRRMRQLLNLPEAEQVEEEAVLIVSINGEEVGLVIDDFQEGIDIIQKPLEGVMSNFPIYAGATLLGDGRVLLILNLAEII